MFTFKYFCSKCGSEATYTSRSPNPPKNSSFECNKCVSKRWLDECNRQSYQMTLIDVKYQGLTSA